MTNNKAYDVNFEKAGVIFRGVVSCINKRIIIDYIDVKHGVNTVCFDNIQPEYVPFNRCEIEFLPKNKDSFPWVKTLHIGSAVRCVNPPRLNRYAIIDGASYLSQRIFPLTCRFRRHRIPGNKYSLYSDSLSHSNRSCLNWIEFRIQVN